MIVRVLTKLKISLSPRATLNLPDPFPKRLCIILIIPPHRQSIFHSPLFKLCWRRLTSPPPPGSLWKPCDPHQNPRLAPLLPPALNNDFSLTGAFLLSWCCVPQNIYFKTILLSEVMNDSKLLWLKMFICLQNLIRVFVLVLWSDVLTSFISKMTRIPNI